MPGSPTFTAAYDVALSTGEIPRSEIGVSRALPGTVNALVVAYLASATFASLAPETRRTRRNILERFRVEHGDKRLAKMDSDVVGRMLEKKIATPFAARNWLKTLRAAIQFGIKVGMLKIDPTMGVKNTKAKTDGFRTWDESDIAKFEVRHPIGSKERLALALLLYTVQRRGDVVRMGRQHVREGMIAVRQNKTGTMLSIPIHPDLRAVLEATPSNHLTFLTTSFGKPFVAAGFTNWFREACNEAGLPRGTSAHGLRKAGCRRLAEAGCSANVIASISGHASLGEVTRYTKAADQVRMAKDGMAMLVSETKKRTTSG
jgi:integrase